jgi:hypothetical protein
MSLLSANNIGLPNTPLLRIWAIMNLRFHFIFSLTNAREMNKRTVISHGLAMSLAKLLNALCCYPFHF